MPRKVTTEEFISRSKEIHNNKYDYSKVVYKNNKTKVEIICPTHGSFWQEPRNHLAPYGCPTCANEGKKCALSEYINKFINVHGNEYDYSLAVYKNNKTPIEIICKTHGSFWQTPANHLTSEGCPKCSGRYKKTFEEFIEQSNKVHKNKYDYSKVEYINTKTKVEIICPTHGSFWQSPSGHLSGAGCRRCLGRDIPQIQSKFVDQANKIHNNKYNYTYSFYRDNRTKVKILCKKHGVFYQRPNDHLNGHGCPICAGVSKSNTEAFIEKAKNKHGDKYDYSEVKYKTAHDKVIIICKKHGEFYQKPNQHLNGHGCKFCSIKFPKEYLIKLHIHSLIMPLDIEDVEFIFNVKSKDNSYIYTLCNKYGIKLNRTNGSSNKEKVLLYNILNILDSLSLKYKVVSNIKVLNPAPEINSFKAPREIDIYIPELNLGFEFNGMYWHKNKPKGYHMEKYNTAKSQGITLFHIWEDEYSCTEDIEVWNEEIEGIILDKIKELDVTK